MNENCPYEKGYILPDEDDDVVYQRIISYSISKKVKDQIERFLNDQIQDKTNIKIQPGFFKPRRKINDEYEEGKSVNWSQCSTSLETKLVHTSTHEDERFGVISMKVIKMNNLNNENFLTEDLFCKYHPVEGNSAHCLIIGFPNKEEAESNRELEFQELRQRLSMIAEWEELPSKFP